MLQCWHQHLSPIILLMVSCFPIPEITGFGTSAEDSAIINKSSHFRHNEPIFQFCMGTICRAFVLTDRICELTRRLVPKHWKHRIPCHGPHRQPIGMYSSLCGYNVLAETLRLHQKRRRIFVCFWFLDFHTVSRPPSPASQASTRSGTAAMPKGKPSCPPARNVAISYIHYTVLQ